MNTSQFYLYNDNTISLLNSYDSDILSYGNININNSAYVLFYVKV